MTHEPRLLPLNQDGLDELRLSTDGDSIGRAPTNTICLADDESISENHARIHYHLGLYWLEDLGSASGTYLTLPRIEEVRLNPDGLRILLEGCEIRVGLTARFKTSGLLPREESLLTDIHARLYGDYVRLAGLSGQERQAFLIKLREYEVRLFRAEDLSAVERPRAEEDQPLGGTVFGSLGSEDLGVFGMELPPMEEDLPDPNDPRPLTVRGTILPGMLEPDEEEADDE